MQKQTEKKKERTKKMNLENLINLDDKLVEAYIMLDYANTLNEQMFKEFEHMRENATEPYELMLVRRTNSVQKLNDIERDYLRNLEKSLDAINKLLKEQIDKQRAIEMPEEKAV